MNFIVAAVNGTHIYQVEPKSPPKLVQSLPRAQPGHPECLVPHAGSGLLAMLQPNGLVGIWDTAMAAMGAPCEVPGQGPIARCYFSSGASFLVTWEHMTSLRMEGKGKGPKGKGSPAFGRAENLSVWALTRRPPQQKDLEVTIQKDGTLKLGINVDHLDGKSGLLLRRVDPEGLVHQHNLQVLKSSPEQMLLPGDQVLAVNEVASSDAQALSEEIQRSATLRLRLKRGSGWLFAHALARFFAPHISPLRWPPIQWTSTERFALRLVTDEVLVLDGQKPSQLLSRIQVQHLSQLMISPSFTAVEGANRSCYFATFSPAPSSCGPAMVRVFSDCAKTARPVLTKGLFSSAAWVTMKWEPSEGKDLLLLVHSSELTEEDLAFRTLHGHGANGLYLLRAEGSREPVTVLTTSEDVLLDVEWCRGADVSAMRRIVTLLGPQPATVALVLYAPGKPIQRVSLDACMHGVRNSISCDNFGRSFCIHVQSERGMGLSNEADSADIFDLRPEPADAVAHCCAVHVPPREREHVGPSVSSVLFSPNGRVLLANVQIEMSSELRCISALDGRQLFSVRFEGICSAMWLSSGAFEAPEFPALDAAANDRRAAVAVELRDREWLQRRRRQLETEHSENGNGDAQQNRDEIAELQEMLALPEDQLIFQFTCSEGSTLMPTAQEELLGGGYRDLALSFCRLRRLAPSKADALAERLEFLTRRLPAKGEVVAKAKAKAKAKATVRRRMPVDPQNAEALGRRVRALQKKLWEIDKLKAAPETLDVLQREKMSSEPEVRIELQQLERQLQLLERPPRMIFDVETEEGLQEIHYYDGDDCYELANTFCQKYGLERGLADLLASNMQERLMPGA